MPVDEGISTTTNTINSKAKS